MDDYGDRDWTKKQDDRMFRQNALADRQPSATVPITIIAWSPLVLIVYLLLRVFAGMKPTYFDAAFAGVCVCILFFFLVREDKRILTRRGFDTSLLPRVALGVFLPWIYLWKRGSAIFLRDLVSMRPFWTYTGLIGVLLFIFTTVMVFTGYFFPLLVATPGQ